MMQVIGFVFSCEIVKPPAAEQGIIVLRQEVYTYLNLFRIEDLGN